MWLCLSAGRREIAARDQSGEPSGASAARNNKMVERGRYGNMPKSSNAERHWLGKRVLAALDHVAAEITRASRLRRPRLTLVVAHSCSSVASGAGQVGTWLNMRRLERPMCGVLCGAAVRTLPTWAVLKHW